FYRWTQRDPWVNADRCRTEAEKVDGWNCTPLELIREHKAGAWGHNPGSVLHEKHAADVRAIDARLAVRDTERPDEPREKLPNPTDYHGGGTMRVRDTEQEP